MGIHERERQEIVAAADEGKLPLWMRDRLLSILGRLAALEGDEPEAVDPEVVLTELRDELVRTRASLRKVRGQRDALLQHASALLRANQPGFVCGGATELRELKLAVDGVVMMKVQEQQQGEGE